MNWIDNSLDKVSTRHLLDNTYKPYTLRKDRVSTRHPLNKTFEFMKKDIRPLDNCM